MDINLFISYVINATKDHGYDGEIEGWEYFWHPNQFPKALLFTITIMTTIGNKSFQKSLRTLTYWVYNQAFSSIKYKSVGLTWLVTGYGHIYPRTLDGQLFTIGYSLVAIGITLAMLANVGNALASALIYSYRYVYRIKNKDFHSCPDIFNYTCPKL